MNFSERRGVFCNPFLSAFRTLPYSVVALNRMLHKPDLNVMETGESKRSKVEVKLFFWQEMICSYWQIAWAGTRRKLVAFVLIFDQIILYSCKSKLQCPITNSQFETSIVFLLISSLQTQVKHASVESLIFIPTIKTVERVEKARGTGIGEAPEPSGKTKYYL